MDASRLNILPPELRVLIHEFVLILPDPIELHVANRSSALRATSTFSKTALAITQTCHQMRKETIPVFYGSNTFKFSRHHSAGQDLFSAIERWNYKLGFAATIAIRNAHIIHDGYLDDLELAKDQVAKMMMYRIPFVHPKKHVVTSFSWDWSLGTKPGDYLGPFELDFNRKDLLTTLEKDFKDGIKDKREKYKTSDFEELEDLDYTEVAFGALLEELKQLYNAGRIS